MVVRKWSMPENYTGETWPDYYSSGFGRSRDSDELEASNFNTALGELGGESETVLIVRENHWAVGWVEWIAIHESDAKALAIAEKLNERRDDYPVLDEGDLSEREQESASDIWRDCYNVRERIAYIRRYDSEFDFLNFRELLGCIRGKYFCGCASTLVGK